MIYEPLHESINCISCCWGGYCWLLRLWPIPAETREHSIVAENREHTIVAETREYKVT